MGQTKYLRIKIDNSYLEVTEAETVPIAINYALESRDNFARKQSSNAFDIDVPASNANDKIFNTYHNAGVMDLTPNETYRRIRDCLIEANGSELLVGKAFLKKAEKKKGVPQGYTINCYGNNADWMIDLKEVTLYDVLSKCVLPGKTPFTFTYSKAYMESTWAFTGMSEAMPLVFAPVKYNDWMDPLLQNDLNYALETMRPSFSIYFVLYWAFRAIGYKIQSTFFDSSYFRRKVMPWTWGSFLNTEKTKYDIHRFSAISAVNPNDADGWKFTQPRGTNYPYQAGIINPNVTDVKNNNGAGDYTWDAAFRSMTWTYLPPHYSNLKILFSANISLKCNVTGSSSYLIITIKWFKNAVLQQDTQLVGIYGKPTGATTFHQITQTVYCEITVAPSDIVTAQIWYNGYTSSGIGAEANTTIKVNEFKIETIKIPIGATIGMDTFLQFKNYKILDLLAGVVDLFNLEFNTNPIDKVILIEPTHPYTTVASPITPLVDGFFKDRLNWTDKSDISIPDSLELYSDSEREVYFKFKDDPSDGGLKQIGDRAQTTPGESKYIFTDRFKAGKQVYENRFFAATCHYDVSEFKDITGTAPQFICILSENIANRSSQEAENTFLPKIAHYQGLMEEVVILGGWKWDNVNQGTLPYMYSVNYRAGGTADTILSYCDENIVGAVGRGLQKRFFLQRLAIMRNGQWLEKAFNLRNRDISNWMHREMIRYNGDNYELIEINNYRPLKDDSTMVFMRKWSPVTTVDGLACYPSSTTGKSILANVMIDDFDVRYTQLLRLPTDI